MTHITATPEGVAALQKFNAGDEVGALAIIGQLNDARDAALQKATDIEKAVGRRDEAELALEAETRGKIDTATVISLYEQVVRLDPGVYWDWIEIDRLYRVLVGEAAWRDLPAAVRVRFGAEALNAAGQVLTLQGNLAGAAKAFADGLAIRRRLTAADPTDVSGQMDVLDELARAGLLTRRPARLPVEDIRKLPAHALAAASPSVAILQRVAVAVQNRTARSSGSGSTISRGVGQAYDEDIGIEEAGGGSRRARTAGGGARRPRSMRPADRSGRSRPVHALVFRSTWLSSGAWATCSCRNAIHPRAMAERDIASTLDNLGDVLKGQGAPGAHFDL